MAKLHPEEYVLATKVIGRAPNALEEAMIAAMWSEHCSYKSSKLHLKKLPSKGSRVVVGPGENAGIVEVGEGLCVAFKVESHNHPSFIEPYQGAATGLGGILRDVFTMGARPFAAMNLLRFGDPDHPLTQRLYNGVIEGISHYGNCFGVPTVKSDVDFSPCYNGNILVNAFAIGVLKKDQIFKGSAQGIGNRVFYVGAKTGRDGINGAVMASDVFEGEQENNRPTVQVGDPFVEKLLLEACLLCFEKNWVLGIQDMGAAGLTCSSFEMAARGSTGMVLNLDKVPTREQNMQPEELMLSESQERMLLVAKPGEEHNICHVFSQLELACAEVGQVTGDGYIRLLWGGGEISCLPARALTEEAPVYDRPWQVVARRENTVENGIEVPFQVMEDFAQYDSDIGCNTLLKHEEAPAALVQIPGSTKAVALAIGCNSKLCEKEPREGSRRAVLERLIEIACVGAIPLGISDCLNMGSPEDPQVMWQIKECIEGIAEVARESEIPVISGNVSLYNASGDKAIWPTPTIALVGLREQLDFSQPFKKKIEGEEWRVGFDESFDWSTQRIQRLCEVVCQLALSDEIIHCWPLKNPQTGDRLPAVKVSIQRGKKAWLEATVAHKVPLQAIK